MGKLHFTENGWRDYLYWQDQDKKTARRINRLFTEMSRTPFAGQGKPEALRGNLSGYWSRRIDEKNRIIYRILAGGAVEIETLRTHYDDT
jgi:toxin YoeB